MSSISIPNQAAGPVRRSITFTIQCRVSNLTTSLLALDQFSLILGAHLLQRYGVLQKMGKVSKGGLAPWQKRRAAELLRENLDGRIRLTDGARECSLSVSHVG